MTTPGIVLQVFQSSTSEWSGRILDKDQEAGRIAGCASVEEVVAVAIEAGLEFGRIEKLDRAPPVNGLQTGTRIEDLTTDFFGDGLDD